MVYRTSKQRLLSLWMLAAILFAVFAFVGRPQKSNAQSAWAPNVYYAVGVQVTYGGRIYQAAQAHTSQTGWEPPNVPALWTDRGTGGGTVPTATRTRTATSGGGTVPTATRTRTRTATSGGGTCTYQNWQYGVNYSPVGTIVRYTNGNYYKLVNVGASGHSDGTDPTISTWYWQPTTCSGGGTVPTATRTRTATSGGGGGTCGSGLGGVLTQDHFNRFFPSRNGFYTYQGLISAANSYPAFAGTGDCNARKREAAAAMANFHHETGGLYYVTEINKGNDLCDESRPYGCPAGTYGYYGRGPIQLSWNFNYYAAGNALGYGNGLLSNPYQVEQSATIAWQTALWYWMTQNGPNTVTAHYAITSQQSFGGTIRSINGSLECNGGNPAQVQSRVNKFNEFIGILGTTAGSGAISC